MVPVEHLLAGAEEFRRQTGRPRVTLSYAQSLDGSLAARRGTRLALSGPESLRMTHQLRARQDAILVGIGTILADDPRLTVRLVDGPDPQPVILDSRLRLPLEANLLQGDRLPWIATTEYADPRKRAKLEAAGARILPLPTDKTGRVSLPALLEHLAGLEINSLMVEGGAQVITAFLTQLLVDQVILTIAPRFLGGLPALEPGSFLPQFPSRLQNLGWERLGDDLIVWGSIVE